MNRSYIQDEKQFPIAKTFALGEEFIHTNQGEDNWFLQIETFDPETGKVKYLPMYDHAYTDGQGHYFLKAYDDGTLPFENASDWRKLKIINRNNPNYRPMN